MTLPRPILGAGPALALSMVLLTSPSQAASVRDCDTWEANARNLAFPVAENVRSFANGVIHVIALDTGGEPACCSAHVMVLMWPPDAPGQTCALISREGTMGWAGADVGAAGAAYDPATGLRIGVPTEIYDGAGNVPGLVRITVNQATRRIVAE